MSNKKIAFILGIIFFITGVSTLPHYGINWDTINHLARGQAYLHYFLTGQKDYKDLPESKVYWQKPEKLLIDTNGIKSEVMKRSYYQIDGMNFNWFMQYDGKGHPPLSDILSASFNHIFFTKLGLINDIDAYRIYAIFLAASLVGLIFFWVSSLYGKFAGFIASLSLTFYPLFWSEAHFNNEKDIPETVFWSFFIFFIWKGVISKSWKWILASGILFGLALGTKFNILFIPFIIIPWIIIIRKIFLQNWKIILSAFTVPVIGFVIFFISWPYLWVDPIKRTMGVINFYKTIGLTSNINQNFLGPFGINTYPVQWIIYTTPVVILIFLAIGLIGAIPYIRKEKYKTTLLFLFWLAIPVMRVTAPKATVYGGIRQIMEYVPALAVFAGLGGLFLRNILEKIFSKLKIPKIFASFIVILAFLPIFIKLIQIHPNENVYFNFLIGGLAGAKERQIPAWGNSFGAAYRQGIVWLNENAEPNSKVVLSYELMPNVPRVWLRPDLNFSNTYRSGYLRQGEYAIGLIYDGIEDRSYYDAYLAKFIKPVYEAKVDGAAILKIWKNDDQSLKLSWKETIIQSVILEKKEHLLRFDLGGKKKISRLEIEYDENDCSPVVSLSVKISPNGKDWGTIAEGLPRVWVVAVLGPQPGDGRFIQPFIGEEIRFIDLIFSPEETCLQNVKDFKVYQFEK